jgi:hypothetical protein
MTVCSTTDQTAQSLNVSRLTFPLLETERSRRPSLMPAAVIQALMPVLDPDRDGDGPDAPSLPFKVGQAPALERNLAADEGEPAASSKSRSRRWIRRPRSISAHALRG